MQDTLVISYEALHSCVTNIAVTNCFKLATVQSRPETAVRPNHTKFVYMSSGYPEGYMCAYRPKSVIAQQILFRDIDPTIGYIHRQINTGSSTTALGRQCQ